MVEWPHSLRVTTGEPAMLLTVCWSSTLPLDVLLSASRGSFPLCAGLQLWPLVEPRLRRVQQGAGQDSLAASSSRSRCSRRLLCVLFAVAVTRLCRDLPDGRGGGLGPTWPVRETGYRDGVEGQKGWGCPPQWRGASHRAGRLNPPLGLARAALDFLLRARLSPSKVARFGMPRRCENAFVMFPIDPHNHT